MENLFEELLECLQENGYELSAIENVYGSDYRTTLENFIEVAKNTNYDSGYGWQEVASDLCIKGKDFLITRIEYDGSERFQFYSLKVPEETEKISKLANSNSGWLSLKEINDRVYEDDEDET